MKYKGEKNVYYFLLHDAWSVIDFPAIELYLQ